MNIEKVEITGDSKEGEVQTVVNYTDSKMTITNTNINANSDENKAFGINNWPDTTINITNTNVFADASRGYADGSYAIGISNSGEMRFYSGSVYGVHSGLDNSANAKLYVYGGTFDGYVHGGIYFGQGENGEAYVENATLQSGPYKGKHSESQGSGHWGCLYIGGGTGTNCSNNKVYMDRCTLLSAGLVLRGSDGEKNNQLYISNSTMESGTTARIDENQKLFVGKGTNITTANVSSADRVEFTNEEYKR